jgi:hypothetical protein
LEIFQARCLGRFFGISSTPMQPFTYNEFSLIIIVKQSILHWFNMKNTIICYRKGLHHDLEIFQARCFVRSFGISSTPMQPVTYNEFSLIIIVKQSIIHWFNMKNSIICDRKGLHHDLEIFQARYLDVFLVFLQHQCNLSHVLSFFLYLLYNRVLYTDFSAKIPLYVIGKVSTTIWKYFSLDVLYVFFYFFNTNATCHMYWNSSYIFCKIEYSTLIQHEK